MPLDFGMDEDNGDCGDLDGVTDYGLHLLWLVLSILKLQEGGKWKKKGKTDETSLHVHAVVLGSEPDLTAGHADLCLIVATVPDGLAASYTFTAKFQRPFLLGEGLVAGVLKDGEQELADELLLVRDPVDASRVEDVLLEVDNVLCASPPTRTSWELKL